MDQEDNNDLGRGACGGEDSTGVKEIQIGFYTAETGIPVNDHGSSPLSSCHSRGSLDNDLKAVEQQDINLSNQEESEKLGRKCNQTYMMIQSMQWNIPVTEDGIRFQNNNQPIGNAERQDSFQTITSEVEEIHAISVNAKVDTKVNGQLGTSNAAFVTSHTGASPGFPLSSEEHHNVAHSDSFNGSQNSTLSSNASNGSRYSQRPKPMITDQTLVTECPLEFIQHVSSHFNGNSGKNWQSLLSLYYWTYNEICLFANKNNAHNDFFRCILNEKSFQDYSIEHLKEDLYNIPKRDTLRDVEKWIDKYNNPAI